MFYNHSMDKYSADIVPCRIMDFDSSVVCREYSLEFFGSSGVDATIKKLLKSQEPPLVQI